MLGPFLGQFAVSIIQNQTYIFLTKCFNNDIITNQGMAVLERNNFIGFFIYRYFHTIFLYISRDPSFIQTILKLNSPESLKYFIDLYLRNCFTSTKNLLDSPTWPVSHRQVTMVWPGPINSATCLAAAIFSPVDAPTKNPSSWRSLKVYNS